MWTVVYRNPHTSNEVTVTIIGETAPPKKRTFRAAGGNRTFKAVKAESEYKEVIIVAKAATKKKANKASEEIEDDELEALDELDDVEDLEDEDDEDVEDVEEDEDDEDEDDEDDEEEAPASKKSKAKSKKSQNAKTDGTIGTAEIAEAAGCDARTLRIFLRKHADRFPKDEETNRYTWPSLKDKVAAQIIKEVKAGGAKAAKQEGLDKLKASKAAKKAGKAEGTTKTKGKKKAKK